MILKGVQINSLKIDQGDFYTALHLAIFEGRVEVIQTLLELEADADINGYKGNCKHFEKLEFIK